MTIKKKAARAGTRTASNAALDSQNLSSTASPIKSMIVRLALWGLLPAGFATWLIQRGGLKDA